MPTDVIIIGGGEPTTYPKFEEVIYFLKERGMKVAIVSNGSGNNRILKCAEAFTEGDWIRLSLDSGSDDVFQRTPKFDSCHVRIGVNAERIRAEQLLRERGRFGTAGGDGYGCGQPADNFLGEAGTRKEGQTR